MSYPQAFHTSCRSGLGGISGFQINAASPGLNRAQLAAMSDAHARYETPNDLPYEPTPEQMRAFPVALKSSVVPAIGPVVSRTEYVGREYRGSGGSADEGRFGNYFCHMVVGGPGEDPFDGLTAIELWDAPHWTTSDAADPTLPELGTLAPGPVDIEAVLAVVAAAPPGVCAALVDCALRAVDGGPPLLIVDPMAQRAAAWLAWITFALPPHLAHSLTFSTFEGRPQDVLSLHVIATTPACDGGPTINSRFARVDATIPAAAAPSLYARAVVTLAAQGPDALSGAVCKLRDAPAAEQGASLAIVGRLSELVEAEDLPAVLGQLLVLLSAGNAGEAAETAAGLRPSETGDRIALREWAQIYLQARRSTAGDPARELASVALGRLVDHLDHLPDDLPGVPSDAPAAPGVGGIGAWLRSVEAAQGSDRSGRLIQHGVRLGLIGLNVPADARVAAVVVHDLDRPTMVAALDTLDADGMNDHVIRQVTETVAVDPDRKRRHSRLLALSRYEMARQTIRLRADELGTFEARASWQAVRVARDPAMRADAARALAALARDVTEEAEVRGLWGEAGPQTEAELNEMLRAYLDAGRRVPAVDSDRAYRRLMTSPLPTATPPASHLGFTLAKLAAEVDQRPEYCAWVTTFDRPQHAMAVGPWSDRAVSALGAGAQDVPDERWHELLGSIAETLVRHRRTAGFAHALTTFQRVEFDRLCQAMGHALARRLNMTNDRPLFAADEFDLWMRLPICGIEDLVLPHALERLSLRDVETVAELIPADLVGHWEQWRERHPRTGARAAVARAFGRRGKDREGDAG